MGLSVVSKRSTRLDPIKPAEPVISIVFMKKSEIYEFNFKYIFQLTTRSWRFNPTEIGGFRIVVSPYLISLEKVACINLILHVIKRCLISICNNSIRLKFKFIQIVYDPTTEER